MKRGTMNIGLDRLEEYQLRAGAIVVTLACHVRKSGPRNYLCDEYALMQYPLELHSMQGSP